MWGCALPHQGCGGKSVETRGRDAWPGKWWNCSQLGVKALETSDLPPPKVVGTCSLCGVRSPQTVTKKRTGGGGGWMDPSQRLWVRWGNRDRAVRPAEASSLSSPPLPCQEGAIWEGCANDKEGKRSSCDLGVVVGAAESEGWCWMCSSCSANTKWCWVVDDAVWGKLGWCRTPQVEMG